MLRERFRALFRRESMRGRILPVLTVALLLVSGGYLAGQLMARDEAQEKRPAVVTLSPRTPTPIPTELPIPTATSPLFPTATPPLFPTATPALSPIATQGNTYDVVAALQAPKSVFSNISPADGTITSSTCLVLSVEIVEAVSGIDLTSVSFLYGASVDLANATGLLPSSLIPMGHSVWYASLNLGGLSEGIRYIGVKGTDKAGNELISDADADTAGNQGNKLTIDPAAPVLSQACPTGT